MDNSCNLHCFDTIGNWFSSFHNLAPGSMVQFWTKYIDIFSNLKKIWSSPNSNIIIFLFWFGSLNQVFIWHNTLIIEIIPPSLLFNFKRNKDFEKTKLYSIDSWLLRTDKLNFPDMRKGVVVWHLTVENVMDCWNFMLAFFSYTLLILHKLFIQMHIWAL